MSADLCFTGGKMGNWSRSDILAIVGVIVSVVALLGIREIHDFVFGPEDESRTIKFFRLVLLQRENVVLTATRLCHPLVD